MKEKNKNVTQYDSSDIKVISAVEAVRKRPGMYFGECDCRGVEQLIFDLAANGFDLCLAKQATTVEVQITDEQIIVKDDGPGFPFDKVCADGAPAVGNYLTRLHNTPSFDGHAPHVHLTFHGIGLAVVNIGSIAFEIESWRNKKLWNQVFSRGKSLEDQHVIAEGNGRGSIIRFKPDPEIFSDVRPRYSVVRNVLFESVHLFPGVRVKLNEEIFLSKNGLKDLLYAYLQNEAIDRWGELIDPFYFHEIIDEVEIQVSIAGISKKGKSQEHSWTNGVRTASHGSHVEGLKAVLSGLKWKPKAFLIHVILHDPQYAGPTRDQLSVPKIKRIVENRLKKPLTSYYEKHIK